MVYEQFHRRDLNPQVNQPVTAYGQVLQSSRLSAFDGRGSCVTGASPGLGLKAGVVADLDRLSGLGEHEEAFAVGITPDLIGHDHAGDGA